ncbi:MAG: type II secretion system ATPase GspE [Desulfococcaceae bacterium]
MTAAISHSLTDILREKAGLSDEAVEEARRIRAEKGGAIGEILLRRKFVTEAQLLEALSELYDLPFWPQLPMSQMESDIIRKVPIQFLKRYAMVPFPRQKPAGGESEKIEGAPEAGGLRDMVIAVNNPSALQPLDDLIRLIDADEVEVVLAYRDAILSAINISYDMNRDSAEQLVQDMEDDESLILQDLDASADLLDDTSDAPIIKLVNHIISQAAKARASDIHIEPYKESFKVRYRVDGILYDLLTPPKAIQAALISRIKVMANMNIAEKRLPQDGRLQVKIGDQDIDVRISTLPTAFGERVVLRLLNKTASLLDLSELGMAPDRLGQLRRLVTSPNGIILVTGPTGSGKTTTLYAVLQSINKPEINIITIEDPVEYQIPGISQIQVNPKIELTFARGLRSIVRQDPDVILVGEIRDRETAEIAVQSALTGHLVFSTLHTNDSASAITRLVDIGVEPFLISSSVLAVAAQRLVRVLCGQCKERYDPEPAMLEGIGITPEEAANHTIYRSQGCAHCFHTGYRGRMSIIEIMEMNEKLKGVILKTYDSNVIKSAAKGMITLRKDGVLKILKGLTTIEEVVRVTQQ